MTRNHFRQCRHTCFKQLQLIVVATTILLHLIVKEVSHNHTVQTVQRRKRGRMSGKTRQTLLLSMEGSVFVQSPWFTMFPTLRNTQSKLTRYSAWIPLPNGVDAVGLAAHMFKCCVSIQALLFFMLHHHLPSPYWEACPAHMGRSFMRATVGRGEPVRTIALGQREAT